MIWPYVILSLFISITRTCLEALDVSFFIIKILDLIDIFCYMVLEYKLINKYVKIKFFENKKRLKILIVCQFVILEILAIVGNYMIDQGIYLG